MHVAMRYFHVCMSILCALFSHDLSLHPLALACISTCLPTPIFSFLPIAAAFFWVLWMLLCLSMCSCQARVKETSGMERGAVCGHMLEQPGPHSRMVLLNFWQ